MQWCVTMQKRLSTVITFFVLRFHTSETHSEPSQTSTMKIFVNVINNFHIEAFSSFTFIKPGTSQI